MQAPASLAGALRGAAFSRLARRVLVVLAATALAACQTPPPAPPDEPPPITPPLAPIEPVPPPAPAAVHKPSPKPPRIGLALGGGAARGFAHIGVLQVLEENGIKPDLVAGTSAGSLVAALYAAGKTPSQLVALADSMDELTITDWSFPLRGVIRGEALAKYVNQQTGNKLIEQMKLPLGIVATDLGNGQAVLFQRGDAGVAVRASSAVPAVFQPVRISGREYVDGGLVSPVPVRFARQMGADVVIAVDISSPPEGNPLGDAMRMLLQTFAIMGRSINQFELRNADVVLTPRLSGVSGADFTARGKAIQAGRDAAEAALATIKAKVAPRAR
ncbi:patatin-like phospholipase family protein [Aquabacterium sp. A7-Y]|uniref:patatin-like phospholipase family protein n=1 Tax=Aquabacterium sp. A7-Y TaxID=1349605 RepID=UPI00223E5C7B|nr:patatin-like phospholipase family protein [Aquabacterium sp. A7-Y]MCW7541587.1 patatin-like phospholipase family protein [Aquabacterium sp. A7-Y]